MIDVTPLVQGAQIRAAGWEWNPLAEILRAYAADHAQMFDWDSGAGEAWARLIDDGRPVALVWTKIPFAFVDVSAIGLKRLLKQAAVEVVELRDFDEPILRLDVGELAPLIDASRWPDAVVPNRMSASDLWWATV